MATRKRSRETDVQIKLAAGANLPAESFILRAFSSCARALPAGADQWDVSGMLYKDGEPFSQAAVKCWLNCGCCSLYGAAELDDEDIAQLKSVTLLHQVLTFAHAVGSPEGLLKAACSQLDALQISVQLLMQTVTVQLNSGALYFYENEPLTLACLSLKKEMENVCSVDSEEDRRELQQLVVKQTEDLLQAAHMLHLQPLLDVLHEFLFQATAGPLGLLYGVLSLVFTEAVLQAALGTSTMSKETYMNSVLAKPCGLTQEYAACHRLFKHTGDIKHVPDQQGALQFEAQLLQDFQGGKVGDPVLVRFDLFKDGDDGGFWIEHNVSGNEVWLPVQLWLGSSVSSAVELDAMMIGNCC